MKDAGDSQAEEDGEADKDRLIEELREAVRARDEFVAIAAHELRNPMTPILMQVDSLLAAARDPSRCRPEVIGPRLEVLEHAAREFVRRATVLLDVSRVASGNIRLEPGEVDFSRLARSVVESMRLAARMARTPLETDIQDGLVGIWDRLALEQVAGNLLSNAIKFGAGRPVALTLRSDGREARLIVRDRGIGIAEEDRARVFQRFERAVTQREHGGFGIGLWLSNQLVTAMGGTISLDSAPGEGATFTVMLPLGCADQQDMSGT